MSDKIWTLLAGLGFCTLFVVVVLNMDTNYEDKQFVANGQYMIPISSKNIDESNTYASIMNNGNSMSCPSTVLAKPKSGVVKFGKPSKFGTNYWITSIASYDDVQAGTFTDASWGVIVNYLHLDNVQDKADFTFGEMGCNDAVKVYEIVAPFNFRYQNCNTNDDGKIIISNDSNNFRIIFDKVDNWFCAGYNYGIKSDDWSNHGTPDNPHYAIYGLSANAKVTGGSASEVIGYASPDTIVHLEYLNNSEWTKITLRDWLSADN